MLNKLFAFTQDRLGFLLENSLILKNIDWLILGSILAVFVSSTFAPSESIGIFAIVAMFLTGVNLLIRKGDKLDCNKFELFLLAYFMFTVISLCGSTMFALSLKGFIKVVIYLGFYLSVVQYLKKNPDKIWWIIFTIAGCVSLETYFGWVQIFVRPEAISTWQDTSYLNPEEVINRVYGTLKPLNPNLFGGYLVATIPTLIASCLYFLNKNKLYHTSIIGGIAIMAMVVLFQTGCRGAYLGLFATLVVITLVAAKYLWSEYKNIFLYGVGGIAGLGTLFIMSVTSLRARVLSIFIMREDSSNSFRFNVYNSCIDMFKDNWLLGIGLGNKNFREIYGLYMRTGFDALSAYNIYLETAVESGIFALISFVGFLFLVIKDAYKYIMSNPNKFGLFAVAVSVASIIGLMVHGFVDTVFFRPQIHFVFWTMVAIINVQTREN